MSAPTSLIRAFPHSTEQPCFTGLQSRNGGFTPGDAKIKSWHDDWGHDGMGKLGISWRHLPVPSYPDLLQTATLNSASVFDLMSSTEMPGAISIRVRPPPC